MHAGELLKQFRKKRGWTQIYLQSKIYYSNTLISQIEKGRQPLTDGHINGIEQANIFRDSELRMLRTQAGIDAAWKKAKVDLSDYLRAPLEYIEGQLLRTRQRRLKKGVTNLSVEEVPRTIQYLNELRDKYPNDRARIDRLQGMALIERIDTLTQVATDSEIEKLARDDLKLLGQRNIRDALKDDPDFYNETLILPAQVLLTAQKFEDAHYMFQKALPQVTTSYAIATCVRDSAAITAIRATKGRFAHAEAGKQLLKEVEIAHKVADGPIVHTGGRVKIMEGLAFCHIFFDDPKITQGAPDFLDKAMEAYQVAEEQGTSRTIYLATITRNKLVHLIHNPEADPQLIEDQVKQAMQFFGQHGYHRYQEQLISNLCMHPNQYLKEYGIHLRQNL
jgi:transcriptional regulator with XRE-family HTH domain